jgi:hypothetical protein
VAREDDVDGFPSGRGDWQPSLHGTTVAVAALPGASDTELTRNTPAAPRVPITWPILRDTTDPTVAGGQYYGPGNRG